MPGKRFALQGKSLPELALADHVDVVQPLAAADSSDLAKDILEAEAAVSEQVAAEPVQAAAKEPVVPVAEPRPAETLADDAKSLHPAGSDPSTHYPEPTLSTKRLLDGSENWLPVPDAESDAPSDLAWRRNIPAACKPTASGTGPLPPGPSEGAATQRALTVHPLFARLYHSALAEHVPKSYVAGTLPAGCVCPPGRRPYHTILTAQASTYQRWQTLIFYHHFRKVQTLQPCTEMTGFTRLLASNGGGPDDLMDYMPTVTVSQLGFDKTRGFQVINRPWTMMQFLKMKEWGERIKEDYVYIAETDHLLLSDIPNRATPKINVAFFFPYMSPVPTEQANVVKRYFDGDHLKVQPVGPSPAIVHVDNLKKLTPLWYQLSVDLKHDNVADRAFGWVLEMWGYSIACARVGVKHYVWQQIQIEPSATWHQNVTVEAPYIYHYTFGVEYSIDGIPFVGAVGEWSLDKRHYFGAPPPKNMAEPPMCAEECAWVWWHSFNEATRALGPMWPSQSGGDTRSFRHGAGGGMDSTPIGKALPLVGPWVIDSASGFLFHFGGRLSSPWGSGKWSVCGDKCVTIELCGQHTLTFDSATAPTKFEVGAASTLGKLRGGGGIGKGGSIDHKFTTPQARSSVWRAESVGTHRGVERLLGTGPWAWSGISTMAFLDLGVLVTPWGQGTWHADIDDPEAVMLSFAGALHKVRTYECHKFTSHRESDGQKVDGWIQLGGGRSSCPRSGGFF